MVVLRRPSCPVTEQLQLQPSPGSLAGRLSEPSFGFDLNKQELPGQSLLRGA